jgi:large subunit ribosomal protein L28
MVLLDQSGLFAYEPRSFPAKKPGNPERIARITMSRRCELTGKGTLVGNNVSHANNKTKRVYRPNIQLIALASELLGNSYKLRISMNALRSVDKNGGLDPFILKSKDSVLSPKALRLKRAIAKKAAAAKAA